MTTTTIVPSAVEDAEDGRQPVVLRRIRVDERDRRILLAIWEGHRTYRDIARVAGMSFSVVHRRVHERLESCGYVDAPKLIKHVLTPGPRFAGVECRSGDRWPLEYAP